MKHFITNGYYSFDKTVPGREIAILTSSKIDW